MTQFDRVREYKNEQYLYLQKKVTGYEVGVQLPPYDARKAIYEEMEAKIRRELGARGLEVVERQFYRSTYKHGAHYLTVRYEIARREMVWLEDK